MRGEAELFPGIAFGNSPCWQHTGTHMQHFSTVSIIDQHHKTSLLGLVINTTEFRAISFSLIQRDHSVRICGSQGSEAENLAVFPSVNAAAQPSGWDQGGRRQFPGGRDTP